MKRVQLETGDAVCLSWLFRPFSVTEWSAGGTRNLAWVRVPPWPLAGFVLGFPAFKSWVASFHLGF